MNLENSDSYALLLFSGVKSLLLMLSNYEK
jgi:hypothetical protein